MVKLTMKTCGAGPGRSWNAGDMIEVADRAEADALIAGGYAIECLPPVKRATPTIETASLEPSHTAVLPAGRGRKPAHRLGDEA